MRFTACPQHTVGVEWELQLLNAETMDLVDGIRSLLDLYSSTPYVKPEVVQSCVEINSGICQDSSDVRRRFERILPGLRQRCANLSMLLGGAGTHPFSRRLALITPSPRNTEMAKAGGYLAHHQITFALHVHVGMPDGDAAMRVLNRLVPYLPLLVAVSANSPCWRGYDTGFASYRQRILAATRNFGAPEPIASWPEYEAFFSLGRRIGAFAGTKDLHWDIRPHPDFGTLEIRVMDAPSSLDWAVALTGFARTLAVWLLNDGSRDRLPVLPAWLARENAYRASRDGLQAELVVSPDGRLQRARDRLEELLIKLAPAAEALGETGSVRLLSQLQARPGDAQLLSQFKRFEPRDVMRWLATNLGGESPWSNRTDAETGKAG